VQKTTEDDDEFKERHHEWKEQVEIIETKRIIAAKTAIPELEAAKQKLVLPNIESTPDEAYLQYQKDLEDEAKTDVETKIAYKAFTPKVVETKIDFNDEANKISFQFQYEPTPEVFAKAVEVVLEPEKFWGRYKNSDGTPNREKFLQDIYFILNRETIISEAMKQAKNATMKQTLLADNTNTNGMNRILPQNMEENELDKQMKASLNGYGNHRR